MHRIVAINFFLAAERLNLRKLTRLWDPAEWIPVELLLDGDQYGGFDAEKLHPSWIVQTSQRHGWWGLWIQPQGKACTWFGQSKSHWDRRPLQSGAHLSIYLSLYKGILLEIPYDLPKSHLSNPTHLFDLICSFFHELVRRSYQTLTLVRVLCSIANGCVLLMLSKRHSASHTWSSQEHPISSLGLEGWWRPRA